MTVEAVPFEASAAAARRFFSADDVIATVPCTVLDALSVGASYGGAVPELHRVTDAHGEVVLFALRTPPFPLILALGTTAAAAELGAERGAASTRDGASLPASVTGPEHLARAYAAAFSIASGRVLTERASRMVLYRLDRLEPPQRPPRDGVFRVGTRADAPHIVPLVEAFQRDVGSVGENASTIDKALDESRIVVWEVNDEIVSLSQHSVLTETTARVRLVYTPPDFRGHGYAAACVSGLVERVLRVRPCVCLFADADNATSNALYQRLGFVEVARYITLTFS